MHSIPDLQVVVAADPASAPAAARDLLDAGATDVSSSDVGGGRVLVYGGPFAARPAAGTAARLRSAGWAADVRPSAGGHLAAWQAHTRPVVVGDRLWVCFPWSEVRGGAEAVVEIDPDGAFGTGAHPSTRLLLSALADRLQVGQSVLDVGCGSGVLAISAVRLGAARVSAVDISPAALRATRRNAARNGVAIDVGDAWPSGVFDVVLANIAATTLVDLAPALAAHVRGGGWLGLSGISPAQVSKVVAAFPRFATAVVVEDDEWSAVVLVS